LFNTIHYRLKAELQTSLMVGLIARVSRAWLRGDHVDNRACLRADRECPCGRRVDRCECRRYRLLSSGDPRATQLVTHLRVCRPDTRAHHPGVRLNLRECHDGRCEYLWY